MNAAVVLDQGGNYSFTNLDEITGKVVVRSTKSVDVAAIVVKLEGESRTRLLSPGGPNGEKPRPQLEYHKVLYRTQTVFPPADILEGRSSKAAYTIPAGQHEYPFRFKIPFNNSCADDRSPLAGMSMSGNGLEFAKPPVRHIKKTLPPTLSGFPGEAEIRYFVKATVQRQSWYKENARTQTPFNFFPIEPPRPQDTGSEVFARQRHAFSIFEDGHLAKAKSKGKGIFGAKKDVAAVSGTAEAPHISVDARLPDPPLLTCNQELPLRIVVKKLSSSSDPIYLQSLQISLVGLTKIRAHGVHRTEGSSWIMTSKSNLGVPVGSPNDPVGTETVLDDRAWRGQVLPNTVAPSFETCNISREYKLDVRIGLSYSGNTPSSSKPQSTVLPLRLDAEVLSGIRPPAALLEAVARSRANAGGASRPHDATASKLKTEGRMSADFGAGQVPPTPIDEAASSAHDLPARPGTAAEQPPAYSEAPPSYEDAIATGLPPVDAPRPDYAPPPAAEDDLLGRDEKKGWTDRLE
ncbi:hypothetical protein LTR53_007809 [Teratosphaeriaceae sp. CCFEE 6253]|nr:hypothetical protein LTR53_007809 [Teratosphaeriaceae sp. CCFEE 6253]